MTPIYELLKTGKFNTRLHNVLYHAWKEARKNKGLSRSDAEWEQLTLVDVLPYLEITKPEDILQFECAGQKTLDEFRKVWPA